MKILWLSNTIFPDLALELKQNTPVVGGWMYGLARDLSNSENIQLAVATARNSSVDFSKEINNIKYYLLKGSNPFEYYDKTLESKWVKIIQDFRPDLVHIHGTEYAQGLSLMTACPDLKYVISIQGLTSVYERYYYGGIPFFEILKNITFRDLIKSDSILAGKKNYKKRGNLVEKIYLRKSSNIIGRTQWDNNHAKTINPTCNYYFCNESLRDLFYESKKWEAKTLEKQTIFLSQATKPLKGLHKVLEAVFLLKKEFPNIKVRVAGGNIIESNSLKSRLKLSGYGKYVRGLLRKYDLKNHVTFTGSLDEKEMIDEYTKCSMFICPSSIENSPNSLGEAQLLGVPTIAANVGGVANMVSHGETGLLYRFEEVEMLAQNIKTVLNSRDLCLKLSENGRVEASKRHDREKNLAQLIKIYNEIYDYRKAKKIT